MSSVKTRTDFDLERVARVVASLEAIQEELCEVFPEREGIIQQLIYALLMREHVLIHGTYGTGKSDLVGTFFRAIAGDRPGAVYSIEVTKGTTEGDVFGVPNVKVMREEGLLIRNPDNTIRAAYFAELDEFLDASLPLLRAMLGVLNERRYRRGHENHDVPLRTAVASTNGSPDELAKRAPEMGAVLDRFIFWAQVHWLDSSESRVRMFQKFLRGERPQTTIDFDDLDHASELVVAATEQIDLKLLNVFEEIVTALRTEWKGKSWREISDRATCKWLMVAEAHALLSGRYEVDVEDFYAIRWAACESGHAWQAQSFDRVAKPIIDKAVEAKAQSLDEVQLQLLENLEHKIPTVPHDASTVSAEQLVNLKRELLGLQKDVQGVKTQLDSTKGRQRKILATLEIRINQVQQLIDGS